MCVVKKKNHNSSSLLSQWHYLPLQDVDFPVLYVYLVSEVTQLVGYPVLVLSGVQSCLSLLFYQLVLLLQLASQLVNLHTEIQI